VTRLLRRPRRALTPLTVTVRRRPSMRADSRSRASALPMRLRQWSCWAELARMRKAVLAHWAALGGDTAMGRLGAENTWAEAAPPSSARPPTMRPKARAVGVVRVGVCMGGPPCKGPLCCGPSLT
jgi:hypothetical protein